MEIGKKNEHLEKEKKVNWKKIGKREKGKSEKLVKFKNRKKGIKGNLGKGEKRIRQLGNLGN